MNKKANGAEGFIIGFFVILLIWGIIGAVAMQDIGNTCTTKVLFLCFSWQRNAIGQFSDMMGTLSGGSSSFNLFNLFGNNPAPSGVSQPAKPVEVVCNKPYIKVGTACCLDQNDNSVCDTDDAALAKQKIDAELKAKQDAEAAALKAKQDAEAAALKVRHDAADFKMQSKLALVKQGMSREEVENTIGFKASQCQGKMQSTDCQFEVIVDGFKIGWIAVFDYQGPGFRYNAQYGMSNEEVV